MQKASRLLLFLAMVGLLILESGCTLEPSADIQPAAEQPTVQQPTAEQPCKTEPRIIATDTARPAMPTPRAVLPDSPQLPMFPWPPPSATARVKLQAFDGSNTLNDVDIRLNSALSENCYYEKRYYALRDTSGFALVTRLEQINEDGAPKPEPERWSSEVVPLKQFDLAALLNALFTANPGYYRIIVFIITAQDFSTKGEGISRIEAEAWLNQGESRLPRVIGEMPFSRDHQVVALIYEFKQPARGETPQQVGTNQSPPGVQHLTKSGLGSLLR